MGNASPAVAASAPLATPANQWAEEFSVVLPPVPTQPDITIQMVRQTVDIELVERGPDTIARVDSVYGLLNDGPDTIGLDEGLRHIQDAVFAQIGSGKSFLLKLLIRRGLPRGCDYVVVDAEDQKQYRALCDYLGGQYVRLGAGSYVRINPLELPPYDPDDDDDLQDPLKDHIGSLLRLLESQQPLAAPSTPDPAPAFPTFRPTSSALNSSKRSSDLFDDLEPAADAPIQFQPRRSRP